MRKVAVIVAGAVAIVPLPVLAQDWQTAMDHQIATSHGLVLDSANRANTRNMERRAAKRARSAPASRAQNCAIVRANLASLTRAERRIYNRACL